MSGKLSVIAFAAVACLAFIACRHFGGAPPSAVRPNWLAHFFSSRRSLSSPPLPGSIVWNLSDVAAHQLEFEEFGVTRLRGALDPEWVWYLQELTDNAKQSPSLIDFLLTFGSLRHYDLVAELPYYDTSRSPRNFLDAHTLLSIMAQVAGEHSELRLVTAALLESPRKPNLDIGWHRDTGAVGPIELNSSVRVQIYLDNVGENGEGANEFMVGSHKLLSADLPMWEGEVDVAEVEARFGTSAALRRWHPRVRAGDAVVYHAGALHRVHAVHPHMQRRMLTFTLATSAARWTMQGLSTGARTLWEKPSFGFQEGDLLAAPLFPRVWPSQEPNFNEKSRQWNSHSVTFTTDVLRYLGLHVQKKVGLWKLRE